MKGGMQTVEKAMHKTMWGEEASAVFTTLSSCPLIVHTHNQLPAAVPMSP